MSPRVRLRHRIGVVLHMVIAFITMILLAQLWLFTVTLEAMENREASTQAAAFALICSVIGCGVVWALIRLFIRAEEDQEDQ